MIKVSKQLTSTFFLKKLSSALMYNGKKKLIYNLVLRKLKAFGSCGITTVFHSIKPIVETQKVRKGSKYYEVPVPIKKSRSLSLLLRWMAKAIRKQAYRNKLERAVQNEFKDLINGTGLTHKESKSLLNKVSANIMYSHFRWR